MSQNHTRDESKTTATNEVEDLSLRWFPIGRSDDAAHRHVHHAKLLGRELAVWRADDDYLNVWENRCLHRGVRLSIGHNDGTELKCIYHGWRYASRTAGCTYIPAHPADAPARTICNRTFPAGERYGLMWTTEQGEGSPPEIPALEAGSPFALRSLPFDAPAALIEEHLDQYQSGGEVTVTELGPHNLLLTSDQASIVFFIQPVDSGESVVHSVLTTAPNPQNELVVLHHHARALTALRDRIETVASRLPEPTPLEPALEQIEPTDLDGQTPPSRDEAELRVTVARKWETGEGIKAFELVPLTGQLPTVQPGAHIDVHLPNGLVRQYSLTNRAGEQEHYVIGVKLEPDSRGGSACLHESVREGDVLAISAPRHNFSLRRDALDTILIAGGIGITPLLSMAETLSQGGHPFTLHYFAQSSSHLAFPDRLEELGDACRTHLGLSPEQTGDQLKDILDSYTTSQHVYICGPGPMLDAARDLAEGHRWPESAVHFEYFKNTTEVDKSAEFTISLARSGVTTTVGAGQSILKVLRDQGIAMPSSCEQGACGTCVVGVIKGEPLHQDVYLKPGERASGERIVTCVSRSLSDELILDI